MPTSSSDWLESVCPHCGNLMKFKPSQLGTTSYCPHCNQTIIVTEASPAELASASVKAKLQRKKLPVWLMWIGAVCGASVLLTLAMVVMANWIPTLGLSALLQLYGGIMLLGMFISFCGVGLWFLFLVYVFSSLTEMRV